MERVVLRTLDRLRKPNNYQGDKSSSRGTTGERTDISTVTYRLIPFNAMETFMLAPTNLLDCYTEELADLWPANDQMTKVVPDLADAAHDKRLTDCLNAAADGIQEHSHTLKSLLEECGESNKEHCKGMEGLVKEARKHALEANIEDADVRNVLIVAQYQRMCHYGLAGFGTAKAFAEALGKKDHAFKLDAITSEIYDADENMTDLADRSINLEAKEG